MKPFAFTLERMRRYKTQLLDKEKSTLAGLRKIRDDIEARIASIEAYRRQESEAFAEKQLHGATAGDLSAHRFMMDNTRHQLDDLAKQLIKAEEEVSRQLHVVIALSQELSGLDKLEEKQREEYRLEEARENELQIAEHLNITMSQKRQTK